MLSQYMHRKNGIVPIKDDYVVAFEWHQGHINHRNMHRRNIRHLIRQIVHSYTIRQSVLYPKVPFAVGVKC